MSTRKIVVAVAATAAAFAGGGPVLAQSFCLQDQYGNQYNLAFDATYGSLTGTVVSAQGCIGEYSLLGTFEYAVWPQQGLVLAVTAANSLGDGDSACIRTFMLRGAFPNFAWYYASGYAGQEATWAACGSPGAAAAGPGGAAK
jgi:hypothetical protein